MERGDGAETSEGRVASVDTSGGDGEVSLFPRSTLLALGQEGLLAPIKMGRKSFYRQSDIERVFDLNK